MLLRRCECVLKKMKLKILVFIIYVNCNFSSGYDKGEQNQPNPNNIIFDRLEYQIFNKSLIKDPVLNVKKVAYNVIAFNFSGTLTQPINEVWIHTKLYYKYRVWQKYLVDIWMEYCRIVNNTATHPFGPIAWSNYLAFKDYLDFSYEIYCPLYGPFSGKTVRNFNISNIVLPLMKAGQYRMNFYASPHQNGPIYGAAQVYASVSDFRIWFGV